MRLLAVEDKPALASLLCAALARAGFAIDAADGMQHALASLAAADYDAIILDLGLADGDGMTLLRGLRKRGNPVPVLILTARDAPEDRVAGLDGGADDYVIKPFHMARSFSRRNPSSPSQAKRGAGSPVELRIRHMTVRRASPWWTVRRSCPCRCAILATRNAASPFRPGSVTRGARTGAIQFRHPDDAECC